MTDISQIRIKRYLYVSTIYSLVHLFVHYLFPYASMCALFIPMYIYVSNIYSYSMFIVVWELIDHSVEQTIKTFCNIFCEHDIPRVLITDRGKNYTSSAFRAFCRELDKSYISSSKFIPMCIIYVCRNTFTTQQKQIPLRCNHMLEI